MKDSAKRALDAYKLANSKEEAYDAAEGAGAIRQRGPTELNAVNRESIGRQAEKADALQQWLQLAD
ncbi:hypothetical protein [Candidatus Palauibacter sp.]|uniref:hypothetical protein n=1 Tax=Candidatus Palauibacter sp. TaxID=3101350 RepID=UPI003AF2BE06